MNNIALQQDIIAVTALVRRVASDGSGPLQMSESTRFVEDVGMESINRLMLMTLLEQELGVNLEQHMSTLVELHTIGDTARFVHALREGRAP